MPKTKADDQHPPAHWDDLLDKGMLGESDRATVILGAAILDTALEVLLQTFLLPSTTGEDPLFDGTNAPLRSFSNRIDLAYRMGLIDAMFARNLHLIRKIRNGFAHNVSGCTFADSDVVSRLTELRRGSGLPENAPEIRTSYPDGPKGDFQMIVSWHQWMLRSRCEHVPRVTAGTKLPGYCAGEAKVAEPQTGAGKIKT